MNIRSGVSAFLVVFLAAAFVSAQDTTPKPVDQQSHWGISLGGVPNWKVPSTLGKAFNGTVNISGNEFAIGLERGRDMGGSWGVLYVHKSLADGSRVDDTSTDCVPSTGQCYTSGKYYLTQGVALDGLEVHKYIPFGTIKRRVQIGLNLGGGLAQFKGQVVTHNLQPVFTFSGPPSFRTNVTQGETVTTDPAKTLVKMSTLPLARIEVAAAALVAPGLKIRVGGGLNLPSYPAVSVTATYLFGSKWR